MHILIGTKRWSRNNTSFVRTVIYKYWLLIKSLSWERPQIDCSIWSGSMRWQNYKVFCKIGQKVHWGKRCVSVLKIFSLSKFIFLVSSCFHFISPTMLIRILEATGPPYPSTIKPWYKSLLQSSLTRCLSVSLQTLCNKPVVTQSHLKWI